MLYYHKVPCLHVIIVMSQFNGYKRLDNVKKKPAIAASIGNAGFLNG